MHIIARRASLREYGIDDYMMCIVLALYIPFTVLGQYARLTAFGVDIWTENTDTITTALKLFFIDESFYLALLALCKIVMLSFFLRIFPNKGVRAVVYTVIGFVASTAAVLIFLQIFQCLPIDYNWEGWEGTFGGHKCLNVNTLTYTAASISILQDLLLLALPLPLLLTLHTSWRKKMNIVVMFSLGVFVLITSCIRLRYIVMFARTVNPTWDYTDTLIWTALEVNVSIIVICLPAIRVFLAQSLPKIFGTTLGSGSGSQPIPGTRGTNKRLASKQVGSKLSSIFSSTRRMDDDAESQLELGDRSHGRTETEIAVDYGQTDNRSNDSASSQNGIHVRKTTEWREEGRREKSLKQEQQQHDYI
ncbi:CFEM domain-containing protein-like protein [Seiridium cupressi]